MKKKLYFTIEKESHDNGLFGGECFTGNKTISVYEIRDNEPKAFATIECQNEDNSRDKINEYLEDNGYMEGEFDLILL
jgi:hypothetical protein